MVVWHSELSKLFKPVDYRCIWKWINNDCIRIILFRKEFWDGFIHNFVVIGLFNLIIFFFWGCLIFVFKALFKQVFVLVHELINDVNQLSCSWSLIHVDSEAFFQKDFNDHMSSHTFIVFPDVLVVPV